MLTCLPLLLSLAALAGPPDPQADPAALLAQARDELESMDNLIDDAESRAVQKELHRKVAHVEELLARLDATVRAGGTVTMQVGVPGGGLGMTMGPGGMQIAVSEGLLGQAGAVPPPPEPDQPPPVSEDRYASILAAVDRESFSDGKLGILKSAAADQWFTCRQVAGLMDAFDFGNDQVDAAVILYPRVVDPENWYVVYEVLDFESDKARLRGRVGR